MSAKNLPPYVPHITGETAALMGVEGTLGTADIAGSARVLPVGVNPQTGALYVQDLSGVTGTTNITGTVVANIATGTQQTLGTVGTVNGVGTVTNIGQVHNAGTIQALPQVSVGTIPQVSVGTIPQVSVGTLPNVNVATGTQQTLGTVANLNNGSVNILTGTLQSSGTTTGVGVVSNLTNGSVNVLTGTITSVTNVAGGTFQLNPVPVPAILQFGTLGTAGGSFFGTLSSASGAGTRHFITGVDIVVQSGTPDVRVLAGTAIQGTGVLAAGQFVPNGGISKRITPAFPTGTNSELTYHFVGAGTAFINISYWKGV